MIISFRKLKTVSVDLSDCRNTSESVRQRENLWKHESTGVKKFSKVLTVC